MVAERCHVNLSDAFPKVVSDADGRHFFVRNYLGKGGFAQCLQVVDELNRPFALKMISRSRLVKHSQNEKMRREISIHKDLSHPNIVRLIANFNDMANVYMLLELCSNDTLLQYINHSAYGFLPERESSTFLCQLLYAVDYLHSKQILHRDLKPGNVLMTEAKQLKLADFGLAIQMKDLGENTSLSGTPNYLAPEVLARRGHSTASECWALGCTLYCMLTGRPPFETETLDLTYDRIANADFSFPGYVTLSAEAVEIIQNLLVINPEVRFRVKEMMTSAFLRRHCLELRQVDENGNFSKSPLYGSQELCKPRDLGAASRDSGLGSEPSLFCPPDVQKQIAVVDHYLYCLRGLTEGWLRLEGMTTAGDKLPLHVVKWVDYTNKYGFGYVLNDKTAGVLFNTGGALAIRPSKHVRRVTVVPQVLSGNQPSSFFEDVLPTKYRRDVRIADMYREYMERELSGASEEREDDHEVHSHYLMLRNKAEETLLMMLSNGTAQFNFLTEHSKVILSGASSMCSALPGDSQRTQMSLTLVGNDKIATQFLVVSGTAAHSEAFLHTLEEMFTLLTEERRYLMGVRSRGPTAC